MFHRQTAFAQANNIHVFVRKLLEVSILFIILPKFMYILV